MGTGESPSRARRSRREGRASFGLVAAAADRSLLRSFADANGHARRILGVRNQAALGGQRSCSAQWLNKNSFVLIKAHRISSSARCFCDDAFVPRLAPRVLFPNGRSPRPIHRAAGSRANRIGIQFARLIAEAQRPLGRQLARCDRRHWLAWSALRRNSRGAGFAPGWLPPIARTHRRSPTPDVQKPSGSRS